MKRIRLLPEKHQMSADGHDVTYVRVELVDENNMVVPDSDMKLHASIDQTASLTAFGSSNPITAENYTTGSFTSYRGAATAIIRSGYQTGSCTLTVSANGLDDVTATLLVTE